MSWFGTSSIVTASVLKNVAFQSLRHFEAAAVVTVGNKVATLIAAVKEKTPDDVPKVKWEGGLLGPAGRSEYPINDFKLAEHLLATRHPDMVAMDGSGPPLLMAYIAVTTLSTEIPDDDWMNSALPYAVLWLTADSALQEKWLAELFIENARQKPLAETGKKFHQGRKQGGLGPLAKAIRHYLKRHPRATTAQVWAGLQQKPPKGMSFVESRSWLGNYVEYDNKLSKNTKYSSFSNAVSAARQELRSRNSAPMKSAD